MSDLDLIPSDRFNIVETVGRPVEPARRPVEPARKKPLPNDPRPTIRLAVGEIERIVDEAEAALIKAGRGLYQRSNAIVFVADAPAKAAHGRDVSALRIFERGDYALMEDFAVSANFERFDKRARDRRRPADLGCQDAEGPYRPLAIPDPVGRNRRPNHARRRIDLEYARLRRSHRLALRPARRGISGDP
jgi:hypothetical protein